MITPPPVFVISIEGSPRRPFVKQLLGRMGLPFQFWPGVVLAGDTELELEAKWKEKLNIPAHLQSRLTVGTKGTKLAFMSLFYALSQQADYPYVLALEDDVMFNTEVQWPKLVWSDYVKADYNHLHLLPPGMICGNQAQLITRNGYRKLGANMANLWAHDVPIDIQMWHNTEQLAGVTHASFRDRGNALFRHAVPYLDPSGSERLQINMMVHSSLDDYVGQSSTGGATSRTGAAVAAVPHANDMHTRHGPSRVEECKG